MCRCYYSNIGTSAIENPSGYYYNRIHRGFQVCLQPRSSDFCWSTVKSLIDQCIYKKTSSVHCSSSTVYYYPCDPKCDHLGLGAGYGHI